MRKLLAALRNLLAGRNAHAELDDELRFHVEMETEANRARGLSAREARRRALADLGSRRSTVEGVSDVRSIGLETTWRDAVHAIRRLRAEPGFAAAAILTLALGIGANTAVFGVVDAVLLRPLPYPEPDRVVEIGNSGQGFVKFSRVLEVWPPALSESPAFEAIGLYVTGAVNVGGESAARVRAAVVTPAFFDVLAVPPALGRALVPSDENGDGRIVVLSDRVWRARFDADPGVIGRRIVIDASPFTIVGVMPRGVAFPTGTMLWMPTNAPTGAKGPVPVTTAVGRMRSGVTPLEARELVIEAAEVNPSSADRVRVESLRHALVGTLTPLAVTVSIAAALVLLVACINATNLLLARVSRRRREFAVRRALGATTGRLVRQVLVESVALSVVGALVALPVALWTLQSARFVLPPTWHGVADISLGSRTLAAVAGLTLFSGVLFGLGPSLSLRSGRAIDAARVAAAPAGDRLWRWFRQGLLVGELAIALILTVGATALTLQVRDMMTVDLGVRGEHALAAELFLPRSTYPTDEARRAFFTDLDAALRATAGVAEVGLADQLPGRAPGMLVAERIGTADGLAAAGPRGAAVVLSASPGYFAAAGLDVVAGRPFGAGDDHLGQPAALVSEGFADALGVSPSRLIGATLAGRAAPGEGRPETIVGVVRDVRLHGPDYPAAVAIYLPFDVKLPVFGPAHIVVRGTGDPVSLAPLLRAAVTALDPDVPLHDIQTFDAIRARLLADRRLAMGTMLVFAGLALALSVVGIYAVTSYLVQHRTREIGIRLAIGASQGAICRDVLRRGAGPALAGILVGAGVSVMLGRIAVSRVPGLEDVGAGMLVALGGGLLAVAFVATLLPALRAMRIDPVKTLRAE